MKLHGKTTTRGTNMTTMQTKPGTNDQHEKVEPTVPREGPMSKAELAASILRGMSIPELAVFEREYGISVTPGTQVTKKYVHMTPEEQAKFRAQHRITV